MAANQPELTVDEQLAEDLSRFYADPLGYVMFCFPWDEEPSIQMVKLSEPWATTYGCEYGPDKWVCEFLEQLGDEVRSRKFDGKNAVTPIRFSTASGHGIGKSALVAWLVKWILDTRPLSKGTVTAMTADQLRAKTWAQVGFWHNLSLTEHWFKYNSGRGNMSLSSLQLDSRGKSLANDWKCEAQTCREENSEAFAGQHAPQATSFYIFDEASGVPNKIYEVRKGGLTDGEPMVFDFGNPTRNSGDFYDNCEGKQRGRYIVRHIDSRSVAITNKEVFKEWEEDFGEDSDFFKVRVRGMFPSLGDLQFMASDEVEAAMKRQLLPDRRAPLLIGVDVARFGDDESVVYPRIGYDARSFAPTAKLGRYRGFDTNQLSGQIVRTIKMFEALGMACSGLFIDTTGGLGAGVFDNLAAWGYNPIPVEFGSRPTEYRTYRYKCDEIWGLVKKALPMLVLPEERTETGEDLRTQLTQRQFGHILQGDKIHLETKKDMKKRLGGEVASSPDIADALACTFAQEVVAKPPLGLQVAAGNVQHEFDPLEVV